MSEPTIAVTIPLDVARSAAAGRTEGYEAVREIVAGALPTEWAEGTVAWITRRPGSDLAVGVFSEGKWRYQIGGPFYESVTHVEPIRTLPADHIAVPRPPDDWDAPTLRHEARNQRDRRNPNLAGWLESVADALEADPA